MQHIQLPKEIIKKTADFNESFSVCPWDVPRLRRRSPRQAKGPPVRFAAPSAGRGSDTGGTLSVSYRKTTF